jgi:biopolymer transport protein ExbB
MMKMRSMMLVAVGVVALSMAVPVGYSQIMTAEGEAPVAVAPSSGGSGGFLAVVFKSGPMAFLLWFSIFGAAGAGVYFAVDCGITIRPVRIMPQVLLDAVAGAMAEGDVLKALKCCDDEPGPLANVLSAGFSHVEEGFEVIEDAIATAASLETEKMMQKITWLSVVANLAPMLGLLGTVQGMIAAFGTLASGAPDIGSLALNISQALFTTAAGLTIAVPCVAFYYVYRNSANKIVLRMEALTMESIKDLRHVEVVED